MLVPKLSLRLKRLLRELLKNGNTPQRIAKRAQIILDLHERLGELSVKQIARLTRQHRMTL